MSFRLDVMLSSLRIALEYTHVTLIIAVSSLIIGSILGLLIALIRLYKVKILSPFFSAVVTILKGVPTVLIILATYLIAAREFDAIAEGFGWAIRFKDVNIIVIAIFALSIMATINASEIFRGTLASIKSGQYDAAKSIGLTTVQTIRRVLIPQAIPVALPMMSNLLIGLVKASSIASMVSVVEVFSAAKISVQQNYRFLEAYIAVAIIYWAINLLIEQSSNLLENRLNKKLRRALND